MLDFFIDNFYTCNDILNTPVSELEFTVLDLETTGLYPYNGDRILEVGLVRINQHQILDTLEFLVNPGIPIPEHISKINKITDDMVNTSPGIETQFDSIHQFIKNSILVGHNLNFDVSFINYELEKHRLPKLEHWMVDTIKVAKQVLPDLPKYSLTALTQFLKIKNPDSHRALSDAKATSELLQILFSKMSAPVLLKDIDPYRSR